ncbi:O-antigen ligase family protein [Curvibacter fontanus]|jgi:O-antigen ligase
MKYLPGFLLLLASWLQPMHVLPWASWHSELLALAALAWFVAVQLLGKRGVMGESQLAVPRLIWLPLALGVYALIQFGLGQIVYFGDALMIALYMGACCMALTVGYQWGAEPALTSQERASEVNLEQLAMTVLAGALLSVSIMLAQAFDVWNTADWVSRTEGYRRPGGNIGQPNHMATLILMGVASVVWLHKTDRLSSRLAVVMQPLLILGLAMTESRTGLLSAVVLTGWWLLRRKVFADVQSVRAVVYAWIGLLLLVWAWPIFISAWHYASTEGVSRAHAGVGVRSVVWAQLLEAALQHPWLGWGLREVSQAHNAVLHLHRESAPFTYAHNVLLDLAVGIGFPLTLVVVVVSARWFWRRMTWVHTPAGWYCMALTIPLVVHSMLEFPHSYVYFLIPVLLAIGVLEAGAAQGAVLKIRVSYASASAFLLFLLMAWSAVEYVAIEEDFRVARFEALRVGQTPSEYAVPESMLLTQLDAMLKATRTRPAPGMSTSDIDLLRRAAGRFPWTAIQNRYALSLALNGHPEEAVRQMQVIRAMHGDKHYEAVKVTWELMAKEKYPQLKKLKLP